MRNGCNQLDPNQINRIADPTRAVLESNALVDKQINNVYRKCICKIRTAQYTTAATSFKLNTKQMIQRDMMR